MNTGTKKNHMTWAGLVFRGLECAHASLNEAAEYNRVFLISVADQNLSVVVKYVA